MLAILLKKEGFEVLTAGSRAEAGTALAAHVVDLVLTDVRLPDGDGLEILRHVKAAAPETVVIVMTGYGTANDAVAARKLGALSYLFKPFDVDEVRIVIREALAARDLRDENVRLKREVRERYGLDKLIGVSGAMASLFGWCGRWRRRARPCSSPGRRHRQGAGGQRIHALSPRVEKPFVSFNCGAIAETLLETELFGHEPGAFTDARQRKKGLFELAHGGTLFLDEVGETSPAMQVKLLRALQERRIRRVAGRRRSRWTCASSPPPTCRSTSWCRRSASARTSSTGCR